MENNAQQMTNDNSRIENLAVDTIFADHDFNCRGFIKGNDVVDLARSIKEHGLLSPIIVQPFTKPEEPKIKWRIVAGYRRFTACRVNKMTTVPAVIKTNLSEEAARILNLTENLKRKDLNKLQEAKAIEPLILRGLTPLEIENHLGMSRGWVNMRLYILELPEAIQTEIAAGLLNDRQIRHLYTIKDNEVRYEYVKEVKKQKLMGKRKVEVPMHRIQKIQNSARVRPTSEILDMCEMLVQLLGGSTLSTVGLAWAGGNVDDYVMYTKIKEEAAKQGIIFEVPDHIKNSKSIQLSNERSHYTSVKLPTLKLA